VPERTTASVGGLPIGLAVGYSRTAFVLSDRDLRAGIHSREDMTVATDSDPYFALPKLYGAPAYARPPRVVPESERPLDPDDLPIVAAMTEEERTYASTVLQASGIYRSTDGVGSSGSSGGGDSVSSAGGNANELAARRLSLRALTGRLGPRPK